KTQVGHGGRPVASRLAGAEELRGLCQALRRRGRGAIEAAITVRAEGLNDDELATLTLLVEESRRPVTYLLVFAAPGKAPGTHEQQLERVAPLLGRDRAVPQVSPRAIRVQFTLKNPVIFALLDTWAHAFRPFASRWRSIRATSSARNGRRRWTAGTSSEPSGRASPSAMQRHPP